MITKSYLIKGVRWLKGDGVIVIALMLAPLPYLLSDKIVLNYSDMFRYIDVALDFQKDQWSFLFNSRRTNLFPFILYLDFKVFGASLVALKYLNVFIINLLLLECWVLGKLLFRNNSGVITAVLVGTSYTFAHFVYFPHIDILLLAMLIMSLIILYHALEFKDGSLGWMVLAGMAIGLSFMVKESALWLIFVTPIYSVLNRTSPKNILKRCCFLLLPFLCIALPVILANPNAFYGRYIRGALFWISAIFTGDTLAIFNNVQGATVPEVTFFNFLTFLINPVFWQFQSIYPVPSFMIWIEQVLLLSSGLYFFLKRSSKPFDQKAKLFLLTVLLVYLPRYIAVSVSGYKIRQILIVFFIFYPILGNIVYELGLKIKSSLLHVSEFQRVKIAMVLLVCTFYFIRMMLFSDGIAYTLNYTGMGHHLRYVLPLHAGIR